LGAADLGQLAISHQHGQTPAALRACCFQSMYRVSAKLLDHWLGDAASVLDEHAGRSFTVLQD
jgi:hypothetical protein